MDTDKPAAVLLLKTPLTVINIGVEDFAEHLQAQDVPVLHVSWTPPAGGDPEMSAILEKLL